MNFKTLTAEQIAAEIDRVTGQIVSYFSGGSAPRMGPLTTPGPRQRSSASE